MKRRFTLSGFTLVELIIVIVVISILAAISIVAYSGTQNKTNDAIVRQDLENIKKKADSYYGINGTYPGTDGSTVSTAQFMAAITTDTSGAGVFNFGKSAYGGFYTANANNFVVKIIHTSTTNPKTVDDYCVGAVSKSGQAFWVSSRNGVRTGSYGSPKDSLSNTNWDTACSSILGFSTASMSNVMSSAYNVNNY